MNLSQIDLNLLVVLRAVLEERSATRAAARLHVTQSAVSNALARLREALRDPLFVRGPRGLVPTPRALAIAPRLEGALAELTALVEGEGPFDPRRTTRTFTLACTDVVGIVLFPILAGLFEKRMPLAALRVVPLEQSVVADLASGRVDLLIGVPPVLPPQCREEAVYEDEMVTIVRLDHPRVRGALKLDTFVELAHVEVAVLGALETRVDSALAKAKRTRRVAFSVAHFAAMPMVVAETDAVATTSRSLADALAAGRNLRVVRAPIELPTIVVRQVWHDRSDSDEATSYLRSLVREAGALRRRRRGAQPLPRRRQRSANAE